MYVCMYETLALTSCTQREHFTILSGQSYFKCRGIILAGTLVTTRSNSGTASETTQPYSHSLHVSMYVCMYVCMYTYDIYLYVCMFYVYMNFPQMRHCNIVCMYVCMYVLYVCMCA